MLLRVYIYPFTLIIIPYVFLCMYIYIYPYEKNKYQESKKKGFPKVPYKSKNMSPNSGFLRVAPKQHEFNMVTFPHILYNC